MPKKPNMAAALAKTKEEAKPTPVPDVGPLTGNPTAASGKGASTRQANRQGQTNISGWFDNPVKYTLDELRLKKQRQLGRRVTMNEIMGEAYNDLFKKYGFPEVAPTKEG